MPKFTVLPRRWRGIRNNESPVLLEPDEWADSKNFDARFGWTNRGSTKEIEQFPVSLSVHGLSNYYDVNGVLNRVWINQEGTIFENTVDTGFKLASGSLQLNSTTGPVPYFGVGTGASVVSRGGDRNAVWKDPSDSTWKELTGPSGLPKGVTFEAGGPRMFAFPGDLGNDAWEWSAVGDFTKWLGSEGGGQEPIGNDREDIVAIEGGLELNMAIYKRNHIYIRDGADPESWRILPTSQTLGIAAPLTLLRIAKGHFFVHDSGAYFLNAVGGISFPSLTFRIQKTWDEMVDNFGAFLRYAHAAYHPRENMIYLWIPNSNSRIMTRLVKIYVADGSVTIHDAKPSGGSHFFPKSGGGQIEFGINSAILSSRGLTDDGTAISAEITSNIFTGSPPSFDMEKRWGKRGIIHFFFETETAAQTVTVTPRIYRGNSRITGTAQNFVLAGDQVSKVKVKMPKESGWGTDYIINITTSTGRLRWLGYAGDYEEVTDE
jgi:hypothetical protein